MLVLAVARRRSIFLAKPCEPDELADVVTRLLGHRPVLVLDDEPTGPARIYH